MPSLRIKRGTRAQLDAAATAGQLAAGEPYLITDEARMAVGLSASAYSRLATADDVDGYIKTPLTINVGPSREFTQPQQAINWLKSKIIRAPVTIQLDDGDYSAVAIFYDVETPLNHVTLRGNPSNPSACRITWQYDAGGFGHGLQVFSRLIVDGIKFIGVADMTNVAYRSILPVRDGFVVLRNCIIDGGFIGVEVVKGAARLENVTMRNVVRGVSCDAGVAEIVSSTITAVGVDDVSIKIGTTYTVCAYGAHVGRITINSATFSNAKHGVLATNNSVILVNSGGTTISGCTVAYLPETPGAPGSTGGLIYR